MADPIYQGIFQEVSQTRLQSLLQQLTGYTPVTVNGQTFSITERYSAAAKAHFRSFWTQYFQDLGLTVQEQAFPSQRANGEDQGHNLEAVLPGKSKDSIVIIVHYDSMGPDGHETENPGVDDDMSGMATMMETARLLVERKALLQHTVRFVATDLEEVGGLEGARQYAASIKALSAKEGFQLVASVDNEQSGWDCGAENSCGFSGGPSGPTFDVFSCSGDGAGYDNQALGDSLAAVASSYSKLSVTRGCISENSDHYAMWEIGVPSVVFSEHDPFENPHFDKEGGDTYERIAKDYYFQIAQIGVTFAATLAGVSAR
jgi:Zn-dependent M28 family amino/carboxypeptidase